MTSDDRHKLRVITGDAKPRRYHKRGEPQQWVCSRCEAETGVAPSRLEAFDEVLSPVFQGEKLVGGLRRKGLRCATCKTEVSVIEKQVR